MAKRRQRRTDDREPPAQEEDYEAWDEERADEDYSQWLGDGCKRAFNPMTLDPSPDLSD